MTACKLSAVIFGNAIIAVANQFALAIQPAETKLNVVFILADDLGSR